MKNKKAFTLVELLAVITILSILVVVTIFSSSAILRNINRKNVAMIRSSIVAAADLYRMNNTDASINSTYQMYEIGIDNLNFEKPIYYKNQKCSSNTNNKVYYQGDSMEYKVIFYCNGNLLIDEGKELAILDIKENIGASLARYLNNGNLPSNDGDGDHYVSIKSLIDNNYLENFSYQDNSCIFDDDYSRIYYTNNPANYKINLYCNNKFIFHEQVDKDEMIRINSAILAAANEYIGNNNAIGERDTGGIYRYVLVSDLQKNGYLGDISYLKELCLDNQRSIVMFNPGCLNRKSVEFYCNSDKIMEVSYPDLICQ